MMITTQGGGDRESYTEAIIILLGLFICQKKLTLHTHTYTTTYLRHNDETNEYSRNHSIDPEDPS